MAQAMPGPYAKKAAIMAQEWTAQALIYTQKSIDKAPAIKRENYRRHNARPCKKAKKPGRIAYKLSKNISIYR